MRQYCTTPGNDKGGTDEFRGDFLCLELGSVARACVIGQLLARYDLVSTFQFGLDKLQSRGSERRDLWFDLDLAIMYA